MIGLFLGETDFPKLIIKKLKKKKIKYLILDLTKKKYLKMILILIIFLSVNLAKF